jgi:hypothetical protein
MRSSLVRWRSTRHALLKSSPVCKELRCAEHKERTCKVYRRSSEARAPTQPGIVCTRPLLRLQRRLHLHSSPSPIPSRFFTASFLSSFPRLRHSMFVCSLPPRISFKNPPCPMAIVFRWDFQRAAYVHCSTEYRIDANQTHSHTKIHTLKLILPSGVRAYAILAYNQLCVYV